MAKIHFKYGAMNDDIGYEIKKSANMTKPQQSSSSKKRILKKEKEGI